MNSIERDIERRNLINTKSVLAFIGYDKLNIFYLDYRLPLGEYVFKKWAFWQFQGISKGAASGVYNSRTGAVLSLGNLHMPDGVKILEFKNRILFFIWAYWMFYTLIKRNRKVHNYKSNSDL